MTRWVAIGSTTPSGKQLFVCLCCGQKDIAPNKECPTLVRLPLGDVVWCHEWENTLRGQRDLQRMAREIENSRATGAKDKE